MFFDRGAGQTACPTDPIIRCREHRAEAYETVVPIGKGETIEVK